MSFRECEIINAGSIFATYAKSYHRDRSYIWCYGISNWSSINVEQFDKMDVWRDDCNVLQLYMLNIDTSAQFINEIDLYSVHNIICNKCQTELTKRNCPKILERLSRSHKIIKLHWDTDEFVILDKSIITHLSGEFPSKYTKENEYSILDNIYFVSNCQDLPRLIKELLHIRNKSRSMECDLMQTIDDIQSIVVNT